MPAATLSGPKPPARTKGRGAREARDQSKVLPVPPGALWEEASRSKTCPHGSAGAPTDSPGRDSTRPMPAAASAWRMREGGGCDTWTNSGRRRRAAASGSSEPGRWRSTLASPRRRACWTRATAACGEAALGLPGQVLIPICVTPERAQASRSCRERIPQTLIHGRAAEGKLAGAITKAPERGAVRRETAAGDLPGRDSA